MTSIWFRSFFKDFKVFHLYKISQNFEKFYKFHNFLFLTFAFLALSKISILGKNICMNGLKYEPKNDWFTKIRRAMQILWTFSRPGQLLSVATPLVGYWLTLFIVKTCSFLNYKALVYIFSLNGFIGKMLIDFYIRVCTLRII